MGLLENVISKVGATGVVGAGASLLGMAGGMVGSAIENGKATNAIKSTTKKVTDFWGREMKTDPTQDSGVNAGRTSMMQAVKSGIASIRKSAANGTAAAEVASSAGNNALNYASQAETAMAATASQKQDNAKANYISAVDAGGKQLAQLHQQRAAEFSKAAGKTMESGLDLIGTAINKSNS